jgi:hypothetical protein
VPVAAERQRNTPESLSVDRTNDTSEPIWVRPKRAAQIGGFGLTRCYELINDGKLKTAKVGGMRLVSVESIKALGDAA